LEKRNDEIASVCKVLSQQEEEVTEEENVQPENTLENGVIEQGEESVEETSNE
jgi:hypothetical protein